MPTEVFRWGKSEEVKKGICIEQGKVFLVLEGNKKDRVQSGVYEWEAEERKDRKSDEPHGWLSE